MLKQELLSHFILTIIHHKFSLSHRCHFAISSLSQQYWKNCQSARACTSPEMVRCCYLLFDRNSRMTTGDQVDYEYLEGSLSFLSRTRMLFWILSGGWGHIPQ